MPMYTREYDRLDELEDSVVHFLPTVCSCNIDTFGSEVDLFHPGTQEPLKDC